jgi:predicted transposase/invertase (TIGR01784 family)
MPNKLLSPKNDLVFQKLFGNPRNEAITGHLLSLILGKQVYNVELDLNKQIIGKREELKTCILDLKVRFNDGEECNIELQVSPYKYMPERMLQYWAMNYGNKLGRGKDYSELKTTISVLIACYKLENLKEIPEYHTSWSIRENKYKDIVLTDKFELHILEVPKIKDTEILKDELAQWLSFINDPEDGRLGKMIYENNKYFQQAKKELEYLSGDEAFQELVENRARFLMDQAVQTKAAREEGLSMGQKKGKIEIAKKMKARNMPIEEIIELTGLSKEEIEKIRKEDEDEKD